MIPILAFRHLRVHPSRTLFLLLGYGLGVGVMIVLLSVGGAMLEQSRDVSLVGGGEITVLPQGIDLEAMRTGGLSGMFFGIDRARFLTRQLLGGPRQAGMVRAVSPLLEGKLLYLTAAGRTVAVRAGGEIPSRARAVSAGLPVTAGAWQDHTADSAWIAPSSTRLYHELDRFHLPPVPDPGWAEWHYFNLTVAPGEWWYLTYLIAGELPRGRWGGRLLASHRTPDGRLERFASDIPADQIGFDTAAADLRLGPHRVIQTDGHYRLTASLDGQLRFDLSLTPEPNRYFPPVDLHQGEWVSGYVVPALRARVTGTICVRGRCRTLRAVSGYHDHNWGIWRDVTWDWGVARGGRFDLLYGAVHAPEDSAGMRRTGAPTILVALVDSLGVRQILRARQVAYRRRAATEPPSGFRLLAWRGSDTVAVDATIHDIQATDRTAAGPGIRFLQLFGDFTLKGSLAGLPIADAGTGFFETYQPR